MSQSANEGSTMKREMGKVYRTLLPFEWRVTNIDLHMFYLTKLISAYYFLSWNEITVNNKCEAGDLHSPELVQNNSTMDWILWTFSVIYFEFQPFKGRIGGASASPRYLQLSGLAQPSETFNPDQPTLWSGAGQYGWKQYYNITVSCWKTLK